jgi:TrpR-related protein YerC/YecD
MTKVPRKKLDDPKKMTRLYKDLVRAFYLLESEEETRDFLTEILTLTEFKVLAKRFQIALMLIEGHDYQTIREELNVSESTITRMSNWLQSGINTVFKVADKIINPEKYLPKRRPGGYIAGDLLTPAIDEGLNYAARKLIKRRKKPKP